ncbi:MAG: nucleotidyltransferase family protein [Alphaproteobacteria bacterium]|nr:nucleotidyltransferase family protein [Alphaproteobacteria bacterium]
MSDRTQQETEFLAIVTSDPDIAAMLAAMRTFDAPDLWLVSGLLFQTVWNTLEGRPRGHGILDHDLFYFDPDTSEEAEDHWIKRAATHFAFARREVQLRNQARVHLWYPEKFGTPYPQLHSSCDGVRQFLMPACMVAVRPQSDGRLELFAPLGLDDVFDRLIRPNPLWQGPPRQRYLEKAARYMRDWPSVRFASEEAA